jgi:hypothetical protein
MVGLVRSLGPESASGEQVRAKCHEEDLRDMRPFWRRPSFATRDEALDGVADIAFGLLVHVRIGHERGVVESFDVGTIFGFPLGGAACPCRHPSLAARKGEE